MPERSIPAGRATAEPARGSPHPQLGEHQSPASVLCLAERTVLSYPELPPAGSLFLANEEITLLLAVYNETIAFALIWLYAQERKITDSPVS